MSKKTTATHAMTLARAKELGEFCPTDLMLAAGVGHAVAYRHIRIWLEKGIVEEIRTPENDRVFRVVAQSDQPQIVPPVAETPLGNIWRSMRMMREFCVIDLVAHSSTCTVVVTENEASEYCAMLLRAGYLRITKRSDDPMTVRYRLLRNTGPKPPRERRVRGIEDENLGQFTRFVGRGK